MVVGNHTEKTNGAIKNVITVKLWVKFLSSSTVDIPVHKGRISILSQIPQQKGNLHKVSKIRTSPIKHKYNL